MAYCNYFSNFNNYNSSLYLPGYENICKKTKTFLWSILPIFGNKTFHSKQKEFKSRNVLEMKMTKTTVTFFSDIANTIIFIHD